jgi:hypothetical protein
MPGAAGFEIINEATASVVVIGGDRRGLEYATLLTDIEDPRLLDLVREPR